MNLVINPVSEKVIKATVKRLPQSMLLTGPEGVGLGTIAKYIADLSDATPIIFLPEKDEKIDLERGVISVDIIRRLFDQTKTKSNERRIFIID
jgi:replication-associated recombination protein RarA